MHLRHLCTSLLLVLSFFLSLSCKQSATPAGSHPPLRIALVTWIGYGPFYIAQEKGFFKEAGVDVDLQKIEGDVERRAAIASGKIDGIALTLDTMIVLRTHGVPLKTVMAIDASDGGDGIVTIPAIVKVEDLKGHQIAFPTGLPSHFFLYSVLKANGLSMKDVKPVAMDADQAGAAFASGKIDAAVTWEPWLSKAKEVGRGHVLANSHAYPFTIEDVLFFREDIVAQRQPEIERLIGAWYRAVDYVSAHPDEARQIMARSFNLPPEKIALLLPGIRYEGRSGNLAAFGTAEKPGFLYALYDRISDAWMEEQVISKRDNAADGLSPGLVRHLQ